MAIEFIPTKADRARFPDLNHLIDAIIRIDDGRDLGYGVLYYGWPKYTDYDLVRHYVDLALLTSKIGLVLIRILPAPNRRDLDNTIESISQASAGAESQFLRSPILRDRSRRLCFSVTPIIFSPGNLDIPDAGIAVFGSEQALLAHVVALNHHDLSTEQLSETRSILEGAKALARPSRRVISNPDHQRLGVSFRRLEEEIASFDARQRQVALTALGCPQRIRGLAGSGKTVILAMKAALTHLDNPESRILVTYYTRSLRDYLRNLITRFYRHFGGGGDPDWNQIHVYHGWGRKDLAGVYREACIRADISPISFAIAQQAKRPNQLPFDYVCGALIETGRTKPYYDLILIDEGQDFPGGFYELCFHLAKGARDQKNIVWAYDELQDVFDVRVRSPEELFGNDLDGQPRISLQRSLPENADTNDFVLPKCYRNQRDILVLAHAVGFGIYGQPVQMLQDRNHWEDVGYEVVRGQMQVGTPVTIRRPDKNSPTRLDTPISPLIDVRSFSTLHQEVEYCVNEFCRFVEGGLQPEDLMAIAIDDRAAQTYVSALSVALAAKGLNSNNIIADRYSEPAFTIPGKVTLSTVYRAKGNEAAVVAVLGCEAVPLNTRTGRNRLFTAFTRTKGWLRITGIDRQFAALRKEIDTAVSFAPEMRFIMPDPAKIETIQRDLSEKDARLQRAQAEMERLKEDLGLTDADLRSLIVGRRRNGRP